jgi:hypothetical protein
MILPWSMVTGGKMTMNPDDWAARVKGVFKAELKSRKIRYSDLADKLRAIGIEEDEKNIAKKISRGGFKAVFLFQCLEAIGCESLSLGDPTIDQRLWRLARPKQRPGHRSVRLEGRGRRIGTDSWLSEEYDLGI